MHDEINIHTYITLLYIRFTHKHKIKHKVEAADSTKQNKNEFLAHFTCKAKEDMK